MPNQIAFKASSKHGHCSAHTPRQAALDFFARFPNARKCDIIQGELDVKEYGTFFVVKLTIGVKSTWPTSWDDITKKTAASLPDTNPQDAVQA